MDAFVMLQELLEQEQFELIFPEKNGQNIRLVYLMNDAVESFLVFHNARMTGEYRADYKGKISASMSFEDSEYILVVRQGEYKDEEDYAYEVVKECYDLPEFAKTYFYYSAFARDLFMTDCWMDNGIVFRYA